MKIKFIIIDVQNSMAMQYIMNDIRSRDDVIYLRVFKKDKTVLDRFFNKLVLLNTRDKRYSHFFRFLEPLCKTRYQLNDVIFSNDTHYYIVFGDGAIHFFSNKFLKNLGKNEKQITPVALLYNPYSTLGKITQCKLTLFNGNIMTFDDRDSKVYGYHCTHEIYSKLINPTNITDKDLYYIGAAKDRLDEILKIFISGKSSEIISDYNIAFVPPKEQKYPDEITYCKLRPYPDTLEEMKKCNCILEVQQSCQSGATLRYYEAVCYNKKLLTNNKNVVNLPFYDSRYMKVFEKPEDIDWAWVKERVPVDYHYDGRFSPTHFIDKIIELEEEKERKELGQEQTD